MAGNIFRELRKELSWHFRSRGKLNQTFLTAKTLKSILLAIGVLVFFNPAPVHAGGPLPEGESRNLVSEKCQRCHNLDPIMKMRGSGAQWSEILEEMVDNGLVLNDKDRKTVLKYLETHLGSSQKN